MRAIRLLLLLISTFFVMVLGFDVDAQETFTNFVTGSPSATQPLAAGDVLPVIQGGVTKNISASYFANNASTKTTSYVVQNIDNKSTIFLNTGGVGGQTLTVNALSTYSDSLFTVRFCNIDIRRLTVSSTDSGSLRLYPGQCNAMVSTGSVLKYATPFQRFRARTLWVGPSGSCNNANDGLVANTGGQICSYNTAIALIQSDLDTGGTSAQIIPAGGAYTENVFFAGYIVGGGDQISINPSGNVAVSNGGSGSTFATRDGGFLTLNGNTFLFTVSCAGGTGIDASQFSVIDTLSVTIGVCGSGNAFIVNDTGHLNISGTTTLVSGSNAVTLFTASATGSLITIGGTVKFNGPTTGTFIFEALLGGVIEYETPITWTNPGNYTGGQYGVVLGGGITSAGDYVNIPGTAGSVTSPGWIQ